MRSGNYFNRIVFAGILFLICMMWTAPQVPAAEAALGEETPTVGDLYILGSYEQNGDPADGSEDLEWIVLDVQEERILLLSLYAIDCMAYHKENLPVTWEESSVREWLDQAFYPAAFSEAEREEILAGDLQNPDNPEYRTAGGNETKDRVFLLSIQEAQAYFSKNALAGYSTCQATEAAKSHGIWTESGSGNCWWWLRSPGRYKDSAAGVGHTGVVGTYGTMVSQTVYGVRPAMWVKTPAMEELEEAAQTEPETIYEDLTVGMTGPEVERLQTALIEAGYLQESADGQYGPKTQAAVAAFQEAGGLEVTGTADSRTQEELYGLSEVKR